MAISEVEGRSGEMLLLLERSCNKCPVIRDFWSARRGFVKDTLGRQHQNTDMLMMVLLRLIFKNQTAALGATHT